MIIFEHETPANEPPDQRLRISVVPEITKGSFRVILTDPAGQHYSVLYFSTLTQGVDFSKTTMENLGLCVLVV